MSLKLSQYSYKQNYGGFQRNEEDEINFLNTSGMKDMVNTSIYEDKSTINQVQDISGFDKSIEDVSNDLSSKNYFNEKSKSKSDFPDNLNNGKFSMRVSV